MKEKIEYYRQILCVMNFILPNILPNYLAKYYGTGSYPEPPHGWHLKIRFTARYNPFTGPCFFRASTAYCEHVGVNLHDGGVNGEIQFL